MLSSFSSRLALSSVLLVATQPTTSALPCEGIDRMYSCDCLPEPNTPKMLVDNPNATSDQFVPAMRALEYCGGGFRCTPKFRPQGGGGTPRAAAGALLCFADAACLAEGARCGRRPCPPLSDLREYNVTNELGQAGAYSCVAPARHPYCVRPACASFVAVERMCACEGRTCACRGYCDARRGPAATYALFFSFGEVFTTERDHNSYFHWGVLAALTVGLAILLVIFCKLCRVALDPASHANEARTPPTLQPVRPLQPRCTVAKVTTARGSPPPTYEQVLKDKCREFRRSVA